jgi:hypothetical protein
VTRTHQPLLVWFGVLGAPVAWTAQLWVGTGLTIAACSVAGRRWDIPVDPLTTALTVLAALTAALAAASSLAVLRATRDASGEPPAGRVRFLATIGITVSFLFGCLIVMTGLGIVFHDLCHQA